MAKMPFTSTMKRSRVIASMPRHTRSLTTTSSLSLFHLLLLSISVLQCFHQITNAEPTLLLPPEQCRQAQSNCTAMVYPYLHNPQYMFPTSLDHVNDMCKMWSRFVDCIRRYIGQCFEESRRALFHRSVETSIDTVHAICSSKVYQNEYLTKATCFKQVSIEHCGANYQSLIDIVSNANAKDEHICCHYAQFKRCVNRPLAEECGRKARNLMDHSMSFLISRCQYYNHLENQQCSSPVPVERKLIPEPEHRDQVPNKIDSPSESDRVVSMPTLHQLQYEDSKPRNNPETSLDPSSSSTTSTSTTTAPNAPVLTTTIASADTATKPTVFYGTVTTEETSFDSSSVEKDNDKDKESSHNELSEGEQLSERLEPAEDGSHQVEQLIVYTMKPESQIGLAGAFGDSGAISAHIPKWFTLIQLTLIMIGWTHWFRHLH